jgi:hypothetical protein
MYSRFSVEPLGTFLTLFISWSPNTYFFGCVCRAFDTFITSVFSGFSFGIRQGAKLSTLLYKRYNNTILDSITKSTLGATIGNNG